MTADWDLDSLPVGIHDPADRYRTARDRKSSSVPEVAELPKVNPAAFAARVLVERARLALADPLGEVDAVAPLSQDAALQSLRGLATPVGNRPLPTTRWVRDIDGRDLLERLGVDPARGRGATRCPAHEDRSPSLSWRLADDGRALLHCFAGCSFESIVGAIR